MGYEPYSVRAVSVKPAPKMVPNSAQRHRIQSAQCRRERILVTGVLGKIKEKWKGVMWRKFRRGSKSAVFGIVFRFKLGKGLGNDVLARQCGRGRCCSKLPRNRVGTAVCRFVNLRTLVFPGFGYGAKDLLEAVWRKVGRAVKWLAVRG